LILCKLITNLTVFSRSWEAIPLSLFATLFFLFFSPLRGNAGGLGYDPTFGVFHCSDRKLTINDLQPHWDDLSTRELKTQWHHTNKNPKFVAVVTHGLDLKSGTMDDIRGVLQDFGGEVLQVGLPGHRLLTTDEGVEPYVSWAGHLRASLCVAKERAKELGNIPSFYVGFSLGGALYEEILSQKIEDTYRVDGVVLFAPAISLRFYSYLARVFFIFGEDFSLPSFIPEPYRVMYGIKMKNFRSLFRLVDQLHSNADQGLNIPTLVFVDPYDELVSPSGIRSFIEQNELSAWTVRETSNSTSILKGTFRHLNFGKESLGVKSWIEVRRELVTHLFKSVEWEPPSYSYGF
jgi:pimeloyl-ACP methyl ester carboxylesterase